MAKYFILAFMFLFSFTTILPAKSTTDVLVGNIKNIDVKVSKESVTTIELEKEVQGLDNLANRYTNVKKLSNKLILVDIRAEYAPEKLGKLVLTDSACNVYVINIVQEEKKEDRAYYIKNSKTEKECEALNNQANFPQNIKYNTMQN